MINRRPVYIQQYFIQKATAVIGLNSIAHMQDNSTKKGDLSFKGGQGLYFLRSSVKKVKINSGC